MTENLMKNKFIKNCIIHNGTKNLNFVQNKKFSRFIIKNLKKCWNFKCFLKSIESFEHFSKKSNLLFNFNFMIQVQNLLISVSLFCSSKSMKNLFMFIFHPLWEDNFETYSYFCIRPLIAFLCCKALISNIKKWVCWILFSEVRRRKKHWI